MALPDDNGNYFEHSFIQTLTEVDQGAAIGSHAAKHYAWER